MKTLQGFYKYKSPTNIHVIDSNYYNLSHSNYKSDTKYNNIYTINYNNIKNNEIKTENNIYKYFSKSQNLFSKDLNHQNNQHISNSQNLNKPNYNFYLSSHKFYSNNGNNNTHKEKTLKNNNLSTLPTIKTSYSTRNSHSQYRNNNFYDDILKNYKNNFFNKNSQLINSNINNQYQIKSNSQTKNNYRYFQSLENQSLSPSTKINFFKNNNIISKLEETTKSLNYFAKLSYPLYKGAKQSEKSYDLIKSYAANTYKGTVRNYNEDRISLMVNIRHSNYQNLKDKGNIKLSFFAIYDGHAGNKCAEYLKNNLHTFILESKYFPSEPLKAIKQGFDKCESKFIDTNHTKSKNDKNKIIQNYDHSGSCAVFLMILNDICYTINLGDSRALYSYNSGSKFYQLTRDHKPNDPIEKSRIYKAGGSIYKTNLATYGFRMGISENNLGFQIPYRILPGRLAVSKFYIVIYIFY